MTGVRVRVLFQKSENREIAPHTEPGQKETFLCAI